MSESVPSPAEVRAALERILASRQFSQASQQSRFLKFVVEETIQGRAADLKEYSIGAALRGFLFDGDLDTTVRVQAGRIRKKLAEYYAGPGVYDSLMIEIPKPGYVPVVRYRSVAQPPVRPVWRRVGLMLSCTSALLIAAGTIALRSRGSPRGRLPVSLVQITRDGGKTCEPAVSRDGRLLAFTSDRAEPGNFDIWIRELDGGEPRRLTRHPATDSTPDISPDSQTVVFRSSRDGGGIYIVPAAGGAEKRIAGGGFSPRFSPDGRWIAYGAIDRPGEGSIYVVAAQGGQSWRIQSQDMPCSCPLWTPDGKAIQFAVSESGSQDWWVAPFDPAGHPAVGANSGLLAAMRRQGLDGVDYVCYRDWLDNDLVLSSKRGLLRVPMTPGMWTVSAGITQILPPVGINGVRVVRPLSGSPSLVYEHYYDQTHIWAVPLSGDLVESTGELRQVADEMTVLGLAGTRPSFSSDARFLVFSNGLEPSTQVWLCDLKMGTKTLLNRGGSFADRPVISSDGKMIAYRQRSGRQEAILITRTAEPTGARQVCADCGEPRSWSLDLKSLLYLRDAGLWVLDMDTGSTRPVLQRDRYQVFHASLSPEGRRIALVIRIPGKDKIQGVIAPFNGTVDPESDWTPIAQETYELSMEWAPKGDALYYFNLRDGTRCLWEQKLDPSGLKPIGEPAGIRHFHRQRRYPSQGSWIAPARDLIGVNLSEGFANLYRFYLP
jgi:Tol biopolymer transport system component